jgi:hypothetical protein
VRLIRLFLFGERNPYLTQAGNELEFVQIICFVSRQNVVDGSWMRAGAAKSAKNERQTAIRMVEQCTRLSNRPTGISASSSSPTVGSAAADAHESTRPEYFYRGHIHMRRSTIVADVECMHGCGAVAGK